MLLRAFLLHVICMYVVTRSEKASLENVYPPKKNPAEGVTGDKNSCIRNDRKKKIPAN